MSYIYHDTTGELVAFEPVGVLEKALFETPAAAKKLAAEFASNPVKTGFTGLVSYERPDGRVYGWVKKEQLREFFWYISQKALLVRDRYDEKQDMKPREGALEKAERELWSLFFPGKPFVSLQEEAQAQAQAAAATPAARPAAQPAAPVPPPPAQPVAQLVAQAAQPAQPVMASAVVSTQMSEAPAPAPAPVPPAAAPAAPPAAVAVGATSAALAVAPPAAAAGAPEAPAARRPKRTVTEMVYDTFHKQAEKEAAEKKDDVSNLRDKIRKVEQDWGLFNIVRLTQTPMQADMLQATMKRTAKLLRGNK